MHRFGVLTLAAAAVVASAFLVLRRSWSDVLNGPLYVSTQKVCQVSGDFDKERQQNTRNVDSGVTGTDLGFPVEWNQKLYFLFGDSRETPPDPDMSGKLPEQTGYDVIATGPVYRDIERDGCPALAFRNDELPFHPVRLIETPDDRPAGKRLGVFETPISGFVSGKWLHAFFTLRDASGRALGDPGPSGGRTILARSDDGLTFERIASVSSGKFQWPVAVVRDIQTLPGLAGREDLPGFNGPVAVIIASGRETSAPGRNGYLFRHGYPYLAVVPLQDIHDTGRWQYFTGIKNGKPQFRNCPNDSTHSCEEFASPLPPFGHEVVLECDALRSKVAQIKKRIAELKEQGEDRRGPVQKPPAMLTTLLNQLASAEQALVACENRPPYHRCVGEVSVAHVAQWDKWAMMYACEAGVDDQVRGIYLRTADVPWGPWSKARLVFDPKAGYCNFMHNAGCPEGTPNPQDLDMKGVPGGEYAPMLLPTYTQVSGDNTTFYFLMSTWNPYQVVMMRTHFVPRTRLPQIFDAFRGTGR